MLNEFLRWYRQQMLSLFSSAGRHPGMRQADALIAEIDPTGPGTAPKIQLLLRRNRREASIGGFETYSQGLVAMRQALQSHPLRGRMVLRLHRHALLEREIILPLAAERDPEQVLIYEMDRNTPFQSGELFWAWHIVRRDPAHDRLHVRLSAVPRREMLPILAALEGAGARASRLEIPLSPGSVRVIELQRPDPAHRRRLRHASVAAGIACVLFTGAVAYLPLAMQRAERDTMEADMARLRPVLARAEALRKDALAKTAGTNVFAAERARVGDVLEVLAAVTEILPDDTFLNSLTLREGRLAIEGHSAGAAKLISAMSSSIVIHNPTFAAPVTHIVNTRVDQFSIQAEVTH